MANCLAVGRAAQEGSASPSLVCLETSAVLRMREQAERLEEKLSRRQEYGVAWWCHAMVSL